MKEVCISESAKASVLAGVFLQAVLILSTGRATAESLPSLQELDAYRRLERSAGRLLKGFKNPEFEDVARFGRINENAEIGRFGYNGNGGLRLYPRDKKLSYRFPLIARLEKGQRYVYSAYIRPHGDVKVQIACDVRFRKTGKYASGYGVWGPTSKPLADGWELQEASFVAKGEPEDLDYKFMAYCLVKSSGDVTSDDNYIEVDNLSIREDVPLWYFCNTWPTHNRVYGESGRVRVHTDFLGDYVVPGGRAVYRIRLVRPDGKVVAEKVLSPDGKGNMTADFGPLRYLGPARLEATLYDVVNRLNLGSREIDVSVTTVPDRTKGLFVQENGVVLKDGKPYMPIAFYTSLLLRSRYSRDEVEGHLRRLHDGGFTAMMEYWTGTLRKKEERDWYYGLCEKYGLDVLNDDFKICGREIETVDRDLPALRAKAEELARYPAIIGFYIMDEGPETYIPALTRIRRMLNEVSPDRLVNCCNILRPSPYLPIADVQGGDSYPINNRPTAALDGCHGDISALRDLAPAALWYAPQCYNWAGKAHGAWQDPEVYRKSGREPTEQELLSVALLNVADGVTGFFFYTYDETVRCPVPGWADKRWEAMCRIAKVLKGLEPFVMSGEGIVDVPHVDKKDPTRVVALSDGCGHQRVIVCGLGRDHETTFELPRGCRGVKGQTGYATVGADGCVRFQGCEFTCDLLQ